MTSALTGKWGEALAAEYLRRKKYKTVAMNYKSRFGEIDIIAENKKELVFVEVKLRKNSDFGAPCEFVTERKQEKIRRTAEAYLAESDFDKLMRFDVIEIYAPKGISEEYTINHIENAF